uniref:Coat protein n=1 Tax=Lithospermum ophiovirus TaxID=2983950 RepID=A0A9N6YKB2_9VIRU|nr:TPA_asm: coat protein [Lithospermum ophiovirus]
MTSESKTISLKELATLCKEYESKKDMETSKINILKEFECFGSGHAPSDNRARIMNKETQMEGGIVKIMNGVPKFIPEGKQSSDDKKSAESSKQKEEVDSGIVSKNPEKAPMNVGGERIQSIDSFLENVKKDSYQIDTKSIEAHLLKFLESVTTEDEGYLTKEISIFYYKQKTYEIQSLVGAGTKILDALLFVSMKDNPEAQGMFNERAVDNLTSMTVGKNVQDAKRAIQAAAVLVYIQGSLPKNFDDDKKPVPKFIKENIYKGDIGNLNAIGKNLSSASTSKFPARVFLNVDINRFPVPVATRAKLSIAGNKGIRYAIFAGTCMKEELFIIGEEMKGPEVAKLTAMNNRIQLAIAISDFMRGLSGNTTAQLRMHPLSPNKPVVKGFLLKITRAIIESLSVEGRISLFNKMESAKNSSFLNDSNFAGEDIAGVRVWRILDNPDADFSDMSVNTLKGIYGVV